MRKQLWVCILILIAFLSGSGLAAPFGKPKVVVKGERAELRFDDGTIIRKGSGAQLQFVSSSREIILEKGAALFSSPKKAGGGLIRVGSAVVTLTHGDVEVLNVKDTAKVICLNGKVQVRSTRDLGQRVNLDPGEMVTIPLDAMEAPPAVTISLPTLVKTSELLKMGPLPSDAAIQKNANKQKGPPNTSPPGGASLEAAAAMTTARITDQQAIQAQQQASALAAQQAAQAAQQQAAQNAARIASARQLADQVAVAQQHQQQQQQAAQRAAQQQQQQAAAAQQRANQGNQGNAFGPGGNQGNQGNQGQGQGNQGQGQGQGNQGQGGGQGRQ